MKYLKTYESYYQPAWFTYLSNLNKEEGLEIAEFLEKMLGTKETPLNVYDGDGEYYSKSAKIYGKSKDDMIFIHNIKYNIIYIHKNKIWDVLESKYNLKYNDIRTIIREYINVTYNLKDSNILSTESYEYNPNIPSWVNHLISLEHYDSVEIAEFLERMLGTKETPLNVYDGKNYRKSTKVYGVSPDDLRFTHYNYEDSKTGGFWIKFNEIWTVLRSKYGLNDTDIKTIIKGYIEETYNLKASYTGGESYLHIEGIEETYNLKGSETLK
jgi:hypothetical protein